MLIDADSMRDEAAKVLHSLHPLDAEYLKNNLILAHNNIQHRSPP